MTVVPHSARAHDRINRCVTTLPAFSRVLLIGMLNLAAVLHAAPSQQEAEQRLVKIQAQIQASQAKLEKDRGEVGLLEQQLRQTEQKIGQLNQHLVQTQSTLDNTRRHIQALGVQKQALLKKLARHHELLHTQIKSEYLYSGQQKLKLLLNQEAPTELARMLVYYDYLHRARLQEIKQAVQTLQSVNEVQDTIAAQQAVAAKIQNDLHNEKQGLERHQQTRTTVLTQLHARVSSEQAKLSSLEKDAEQLKRLLYDLDEALADTSLFPPDQALQFIARKGKLYWPVVGKPSNRFGQERNLSSAKLSWQGVFIPSKEGNYVRSIFSGRVVFAQWMRGLGLLIIIDHDDGYMSLYGHNQSLYKQTGEWVEAGDLIATVGNSGGNARPGLYFEVRKQGKPLNPAKWCTKPAATRPG